MSKGKRRSLPDLLLCKGCGLVSPPEEIDRHGGICAECFMRRERWCGGGGTRVVTSALTIHTSARCPAVRRSTRWRLWRHEDVMYAHMSGDFDVCGRCKPVV